MDIGQGHFLYQLVLSEPDTGGTGWQSWPTPTAADSYTGDMRSTQRRQGSRHSVNLSSAVQEPGMWPTPRASIRGDCPCERGRRTPDLASAVKMFATPQARDYRTGQASRWEDRGHRSRNLNDQVAMYPPPTTGAGLCGGTGNFQQLKRLEGEGKITEEERRSMSQGNGGSLNPGWVEWLMGFPAEIGRAHV